MIPKLLSLYIFLSLFLFSLSKDKVIFVFEHFRHGARSPSGVNEQGLDVLKEKWFGEKELSYVGQRQHFLLGQFMRNKYSDLINYKEYNPREIEALSTRTNRTVMSARAQLTGIFIDKKTNLFNDWQEETSVPYYLKELIKKNDFNKSTLYPENYPEEIPVHVVDYAEKLIQLEKDDMCPAIKNIRKKNKKRKEIKDFIKEFNSTYGEQLLRINNISDKDFYMDYDNINDLCIATIINVFDDRNFSIFNNEIDIDKLYNVSTKWFELKIKTVYASDADGLIGYIGASIFLRKVLSYMERILTADPSDKNDAPKMVLFASHDTAIATMEALIFSLFEIETLPPYFSASYIFELVEDKENNEYKVNFVFNNNTLKTVTYDDFRTQILNFSWTYERTGNYCGFLPEKEENKFGDTLNETITTIEQKTNSNKKWTVVLVIFSVLNVIAIGAIGFLLFKFRSSKNGSDYLDNLNNNN